jgi:hypothetical protein
VADERERRREERGPADSLQRAGDVEGGDAPRQAAQQGGEGEQHDARHEQQASPVAVRERTGGEDQRRKRQGVRVHHPLQPGQARVEALLHVR